MAIRGGRSIETLLAQGGHYVDPATGAVVPPIHPSTTYARDERYELIGYGYSRSGNPTCAQVEDVLARLEGAEDALVFASGLAGIATFFDTVPAGGHVAAPRVMYHGAADWLRRLAGRRRIGVTFFDAASPPRAAPSPRAAGASGAAASPRAAGASGVAASPGAAGASGVAASPGAAAPSPPPEASPPPVTSAPPEASARPRATAPPEAAVRPEAAGALEAAVRPGETSVVWIEASVNPTWDVIDVRAAAEIAHAAGAILGVDATATPAVTLRALDLGADVVFHSGTKYLAGHSDVTAGVLATRRADDRWEDVKLARTLMGGVLGPFESWLLLRGMRTLHVRYERQAANAMAIARHFERHPKLEGVLYPGLESHPGHAVAKRQMTNGFGAMLSLLVAGGAEDAKRVATRTRLFVPATSLGGVESLIEHRATVEGPHSVVPENLLRVSVGIENADELIADLEQALG